MKSLPFLLTAVLAVTQLSFSEQVPSLKDAFADKFLIGTILKDRMLGDPDYPDYSIVEKHFDVITAENAMKWGRMEPTNGDLRLALPDAMARYGAENGLDMVGHTLFWHSQTADWVYRDAKGALLSRDELLARMRERARMMAERYGDRIKIWDVVNESIERDGSWRKSMYQQVIGDDFTEQAFRIAMEELPADSKLLYNDYNMTNPGRRDAVVAMVKDFQSKGIRIDGIGIQGHWGMSYPDVADIAESIQAFASTGLKVHVTELDIDLIGRDHFFGANVDIRTLEANEENNPYPDGILPASEEGRFAERYAEVFKMLVENADHIDRVTFWGITDKDSWLNNFPVRGRTNFALLFDRAGKPKPAFYRVLETAKGN